MGGGGVKCSRDSSVFMLCIFKTVGLHVSSVQVRIFPYLIGRESAFADNLKWMACANKGLGLYENHVPTHFHIRVLVMMRHLCMEGSRTCGTAHTCACYMCPSLHACVCTGPDSFSPRSSEVALWGIRGQSALIPLPVSLLAAQCRRFPTPQMSAP